MNNAVETELEVKFLVTNLARLEKKLEQIGAKLVVPRLLEINLRFDTPDGKLTRDSRVLRLRKDKTIKLTYKGPGFDSDGAYLRQEIEFQVADFEAAQHFLEALGYQIFLRYEKYRTTYQVDDTEIVLDEMPYGNFVEIEGPNTFEIKKISSLLSLNWERRIYDSYATIFLKICQSRGLKLKDLTFESFATIKKPLSKLTYRYADKL